MKIKALILIWLYTITLSAHAGEEETALIDKITAAYGGDVVVNLSSIKIEDRFLSPTTGQSRSPDREEIGRLALNLSLDLKNNRLKSETFNSGRGGSFHQATISDGETAHNINYRSMTYGEASSADYYGIVGGSLRTTDAYLVYELNKAKDEAKYLGEVDYMNRPHVKLTMPFPQSPELTLYIDLETHLISKMTRNNPQFGDLDYIYLDHQQHNGVSYAAAINFFLAGVPNLISTRHQVEFNVEMTDATFAMPSGMEEESERIDTSEMLVNKISDRVYHIGQGNGYSIFINTSDGIVAAGGYPALEARFDRYKDESETHKPLRYQVVTHHHSDHLGGLNEAVALGAKLITVAGNVDAIKDGVNPAPEDRHLMTIGNRITLGEGRNRVEIYEVATIHAASFLVTYVPAEKLVFIADHMGSPYKTGTPAGNLGTVSMLSALEALDIDVKRIATAHNARIFSYRDMENSVADYAPLNCSRPICT